MTFVGMDLDVGGHFCLRPRGSVVLVKVFGSQFVTHKVGKNWEWLNLY